MDALLILSGMVATLIGWIWLVVQARALGLGSLLLAVFLPWVTLLLRRRGFAVLPRLLLLLGVLALLAGGAWLQHAQPERFATLLAGDWLSSAAAQGDIQGQLMGQRFVPERAVWKGNELVLEEGERERVRRSLRIRFANAPDLLRQSRIERLPGDAGPGPELVLQWYNGALQAPGLRRVAQGYTLSLAFAVQADSRTRVTVYLHLPSQDATWLTGEVWLAETPEWLITLEREATSRPSAALASQVAARPGVAQPVELQLGAWQPVSLLALLDEPELFLEQNVRLITVNARVYEGRLKSVSGDQRVVIAQPRGPNQVDYQFHPLDIHSLEVRYRSLR